MVRLWRRPADQRHIGSISGCVGHIVRLVGQYRAKVQLECPQMAQLRPPAWSLAMSAFGRGKADLCGRHGRTAAVHGAAYLCRLRVSSLPSMRLATTSQTSTPHPQLPSRATSDGPHPPVAAMSVFSSLARSLCRACSPWRCAAPIRRRRPPPVELQAISPHRDCTIIRFGAARASSLRSGKQTSCRVGIIEPTVRASRIRRDCRHCSQ